MLQKYDSLKCVYALKGMPKSGTTWMELVVKAILDYHCQNAGGRCNQIEMVNSRDYYMYVHVLWTYACLSSLSGYT